MGVIMKLFSLHYFMFQGNLIMVFRIGGPIHPTMENSTDVINFFNDGFPNPLCRAIIESWPNFFWLIIVFKKNL